ncbi:hypothetical protein U1Q18_017626 [Sarracenia purpurea var. burkii]
MEIYHGIESWVRGKGAGEEAGSEGHMEEYKLKNGILHAFEPESPKDPAGKRENAELGNLDIHSIDLVVRFFAYGIDSSQEELDVSLPSYGGLDATIHGQTSTPSSLKKLFDLFPLSPSHCLSGKWLSDSSPLLYAKSMDY